MGEAPGRINLPVGMILRAMPAEALASDLADFEANGSAAQEVAVPMQMILGQLPSGKVEMSVQEIVPHMPQGFLKSSEELAPYLNAAVVLPLMDVVMRIPPDLLALRPDQKEVDAAVTNMADPFTQESLREQAAAAAAAAEAAQSAGQPKIIEESQSPQEEFVPRDRIRTVAPPRRTGNEPAIGVGPGPARAAFPSATPPPPPMPQAARVPAPPPVPAPPTPFVPPTVSAAPPPPPVLPTAIPMRSTTVLPPQPTVQLPTPPMPPVTMTTPPPPASTAPVPPVPRHTGPIPAPPPPRHTQSIALPSELPPTEETTEAVPEPTPETASTEPDELQRLAALAMAQLGDNPETEVPAENALTAATVPMPTAVLPTPSATVPVPEPEATNHHTPTPVPVAFQPAPTPVPVAPQPVPVAAAPEPASAEIPTDAPVAFNLNTCTADDLVKNIPGCTATLAAAIIAHRTKIGAFKAIEELLDVPGMTKSTYVELTGEQPPAHRIGISINELLGFPGDMTVSLKDVTERIACWPDVTGCVLSQNSGLSLVGSTPTGVDINAVVAFAPRMFDTINKSFIEVAGKETDALSIPTLETSYHLFRNQDLYLIIMSRLPQMPERHTKVARLVLAELSTRKD